MQLQTCSVFLAGTDCLAIKQGPKSLDAANIVGVWRLTIYSLFSSFMSARMCFLLQMYQVESKGLIIYSVTAYN